MGSNNSFIWAELKQILYFSRLFFYKKKYTEGSLKSLSCTPSLPFTDSVDTVTLSKPTYIQDRNC